MLLFIICSVILVYLLYSWISIMLNKQGHNIKGPIPLPVIGNALTFNVPPTEFLNLLHKLSLIYGNAYLVYVISSPLVLLSHPKYVEPVVTSSELITKGDVYDFLRPWLGNGLLTATGQRWKTHRKFLTPAFHFNILHNFLPIFCKNTRRLADKLADVADGRPVDLVHMVSLASLDNVTEAIMGLSVDSQNNSGSEYVKSIEGLSRIISSRIQYPFLGADFIFNLTADKKKQDAAIKYLHKYGRDVIAARRDEIRKSKITKIQDSDDLGIKNRYAFLDSLLVAEVDEELIREEVDTFMFEGFDTTTSGICFALYCISRHPDVQAKILQERKDILGDDLDRDPTFATLDGHITMDYLVQNVKQVEGRLEVQFQGGLVIKFEDCWLRDHCRCSSCYHPEQFQRAKHLLEIPEVTIAHLFYDKSKINVKWSDNHESTYLSNFLIKFDYNTWKSSRRLKPILWRGNRIADRVARVSVDSFLGSKEGSRKVFQSLLDFGVALIDGVEPTETATEKVCKALGGVQHTLFGGMWEFTSRPDHADTAYTNLPLAVHNDNTYFTEAAGLQVLHCLKHDNPVGGETILVDGFYGATQLKDDCPDSFEFLSSFDVEAEYIEDGHHHRYAAPVIRVDWKTGDLKQIRFNVYDRSPMAFQNSLECRTYYRSLRTLAKYYEDPNNQWQFKLSPGVVMVMDNFRVLHGRTAFSGERILCGSYVSRSDWLDKARALGLIQ